MFTHQQNDTPRFSPFADTSLQDLFSGMNDGQLATLIQASEDALNILSPTDADYNAIKDQLDLRTAEQRRLESAEALA